MLSLLLTHHVKKEYDPLVLSELGTEKIVRSSVTHTSYQKKVSTIRTHHEKKCIPLVLAGLGREKFVLSSVTL